MAIVVICASTLVPSAASGAVRYVSPGGSGDCSPSSPCNIVTGINSAPAGSEVILAPGVYTTSTTLTSAGGLNVHGASAQPRPRVVSSAPNALSLSGANPRVADLELEHTGTFTGLSVFSGSSNVERVSVRSSGFDACNVGTDGLLRDSVCVSTASGGNAFHLDFAGSGTMSTLRLRNVTAIATGPGSVGIWTRVSGSATLDLDAREVIAQGSADDVTAEVPGFTSTDTVTMQHSNYDDVSPAVSTASVTPPGTNTNQTAPPVFAETTAYHEAPGSPTIDAGASDLATGAVDLDGDPRGLGAANDIGADELVPPSPGAGDAIPPETTIGRHPRKRTRRRSATFTFTGGEPGVTFECRLDGRPFSVCSTPKRFKRLKRRRHVFSVRAVDHAGNIDPTPVSYRWKIKKKKSRRHR